MKKICLLLTFCVTMSFIGNSQEGLSDDLGVRFGVVVTPGLSWLKSAKAGQSSNGTSLSFAYGLQLEFPLSKHVSLVTGLSQANYSGATKFDTDVNYKYTPIVDGAAQPEVTSLLTSRTYVFRTVEIPFKLKLKTPEIGYFTYFLGVGVVGNVVFDSYSKENNVESATNGSSILSDDLAKIDANDETSWHRAGSVFELGFEYTFVGSTSLVVSLQWENAFTSILNKSPASLTYTSTGLPFSQSAKMDNIGLTVGILF